MKKDDASGIGTILLTSSGSSSSLRGSTNSPTKKINQKSHIKLWKAILQEFFVV